MPCIYPDIGMSEYAFITFSANPQGPLLELFLDCQVNYYEFGSNNRSALKKEMKKVIESKKTIETEELNEINLDYAPFYRSLAKAGISQNQLKTQYEISAATLSRMKHGCNMTLACVGRLMKILGTEDPNKIVKFKIRY